MQWTPEHMQWGERHFDITSSNRSPLHKAEAFMGHLQQAYHYAWANDDISALTASNLLKKYAEKYSGILECPDERMLPGLYPDSAQGHLNGRKCEGESWQEVIYPLSCVVPGRAVSKAGAAAAVPSADMSTGVRGSPGLAGSLPETNFSSSSSSSTSSCGSHAVGSLHSGLVPQEYSMGYSGSFMHSSYNTQSVAGLASPHPSPLHSSGLLQRPPRAPPQNVIPSYNTGSTCLSSYSYSAAEYPPQTAVATGYSPGGAPPPSAYVPAGLAAPTPLPSSSLPGYPYQPRTLGPIVPKPLNGSSASSLKRKAFFMGGQEEINSTYGNFSYSQQCSPESPVYGVQDNTIPSTVGGNGFDGDVEASPLAFKPTKQLMSSDQQRKFGGQCSRAPTPLTYPPSRSSLGGLHSGDSFDKFASPGANEHSDDRGHVSRSMAITGIGSATSPSHPAAERLQDIDPHLVELVNKEMVQQVSPVDWSDIAGLELAKAVLKEELLWPMLRPDMFSELATIPRTILLFGPKGTGRTLLARCVASQLGASFLRLNGSTLVTKLRAEGDKIVNASFLVARCQQPSVVFIHDVDLLLSSQHNEDSSVDRTKTEFLTQLDNVLASPQDQVVVICSTSKPEEIDGSLRRYFMKRLLIPLPDSTARHQIISQLLSQHNCCLSEKEVGVLTQQTEGFSGLDISHLCQEAALGLLQAAAVGLSAVLPGQLRPITYQDIKNVLCKIQSNKSQTDLDVYTEWNRMFGCSQ